VRFGASGERGAFFMPHMNPLHLLLLAYRICDSVERVAGETIDAINSGIRDDLNYQICDSLCHGIAPFGTACLNSKPRRSPRIAARDLILVDLALDGLKGCCEAVNS
jgi:hypothetical protein